MKFSDIFTDKNDSAEVKKFLGQINNHPELYAILEHYYSRILDLKPLLKNVKIDQAQLTLIIFSTFTEITSKIATIHEEKIANLISDVLCRIRLMHYKEFANNCSEFDEGLLLAINHYCMITKTGKNDFPSLFRSKIKKRVVKRKKRVMKKETVIYKSLSFNGSSAQKKLTESLLNRSAWFLKEFSLKKFLRNTTLKPILFCRINSLGPLALFLHLLNVEELLTAESGNCYMTIAARSIWWRNHHPNPRYLSKLSSEILGKPEKYAAIINSLWQ